MWRNAVTHSIWGPVIDIGTLLVIVLLFGIVLFMIVRREKLDAARQKIVVPESTEPPCIMKDGKPVGFPCGARPGCGGPFCIFAKDD